MEIITGVERRRRWRVEDKLRIVAECERPGASLAAVARQHDVSSGLLWNWRRQARRGLLRVNFAPNFFPVQVTDEPISRDPGQRSTSLTVPPGTPTSADAQIEIMLADGTMVRAGQNVSLATLRRVLAALRG
jgi:transposase-like protein